MTTHEAILKTLHNAKRPMSIEEIATELNRAKLESDGGEPLVKDYHVLGGISKHPALFHREGDLVMVRFPVDPNRAEVLTKWYLRLNGYFTVDNFIVHAGDDETRISNNVVSNHTEVDVLAIRHKFNKEITGELHIANDEKLLGNQTSDLDFIIAETKTGNSTRPNSVWRDKQAHVVEYLLRFAGFINGEKQITEFAARLCEEYQYQDTNDKFSIRLVLFSEKDLNQDWQMLTNIKFKDIIDFLVDIRGECWLKTNIGIASIHHQWDPLIKSIFEIANNFAMPQEQRKYLIQELLSGDT